MIPPLGLLASISSPASMPAGAFPLTDMEASWFDPSDDAEDLDAIMDDEGRARGAMWALRSFPLDGLLPLSPVTPPRPAPQPPSSMSRRVRPRHIQMREPERAGLFTVSEVDEPAYEDIFSSTYNLERSRDESQQRDQVYTLSVPPPRSSSAHSQTHFADEAHLDFPTDVGMSYDTSADEVPATASPSDIAFNRLSWSSTNSADSAAEPPLLSRSRSSSGGSRPGNSQDLPQTPESESEDPFVARSPPVTPPRPTSTDHFSPRTPSPPAQRASPGSSSSKSSSRRSPPAPLDLRPRSFPPNLPLCDGTPTRIGNASGTAGTGLLPALEIRPAEQWRAARAADAAASPHTPLRPARAAARLVPGAPRRPSRRHPAADLESVFDDLMRSCEDDTPSRRAGPAAAAASTSTSGLFPLPPPRRALLPRDPCGSPPALDSPAAQSDTTLASPRTPTSAITTADMLAAIGPPPPPRAPRRRPPLPAVQPPQSPMFTSRLARRTYPPASAERPQLRGDHSFLRSLSVNDVDLSSEEFSLRSASPNSLFTVGSNRSVSTAATSIGSTSSSRSEPGSCSSGSSRALPSRSRLPTAWTF